MNIYALVREVNDLFEGSRDDHKFWKSEAHNAVVAIFKIITEALHRGEKVWIPGFGTFDVKLRPAHKRMFFVPAKKIVVFRASRDLQRLIGKKR